MQIQKRGRRLQESLTTDPEAVNSNTVYLTLQINAGANFRTQAVEADVQSAMTAGGAYNVVPVQVNLKLTKLFIYFKKGTLKMFA